VADPKDQPPAHWGGTEPRRVLAADGTVVGDPDVGLDAGELRALLRWMVVARRLDRECIALQRQGELTVYPGFEGQEAAQVGSAAALASRDMVWPTFRELAAALVRGVDPVQYLQYHRGTWHGGPYDPRATRFGPICIPIATQIAHAAGCALGQQLDGDDAVSLAYFGDGATSEGDFHEAANLAGIWRLPLVLFCQNNGWAISLPTGKQTAGEIWRRAEGYGFPGVRVDGNDVLAVYAATREALERARRGDGPTLIEALTYRIGAHSTADDARRYRADPEVEAARAFDPIARFSAWLLAAGHADAAFVADSEAEADRFAMTVRAGVVATPAPPAEWQFDWVYAEPGASFERMRAEALS
jgi:2-oxoisovalerate dehydrogenase E1 component subunit alpha